MRIIDNIDKFENKESLKGAIEDIRPVIRDVENEGIKAVKKYTQKFDGVEIQNFEISEEEKTAALESLNSEEREAIEESVERIERFHRNQKPEEWSEDFSEGFKAGEIIRPLDSVGCYIPGGNYPLPSSALMTVIPAKIAEVEEVIVCTPPDKNGDANDYTIAAAEIAGADRIFKIGGAQAIAAMAYGCEIPEVNKIVGPGNKYVTAAKKLVYGKVGIDFLAGPSEVMIVSDGNNNPELIAADLLAQSEHDTDARAFLTTTSREEAEEVKKEVEKQLNQFSESETARKSIEKNGGIFIADSIEEAMEKVNRIAPEHLEIQIEEPERIIPKVQNAGTIFIGEQSAEALGDYTTGTNHVLPTGGAARYRSGLGVEDFMKKITWERQTTESLKEISETAKTLAKIEQLEGHRRSIQRRIKNEY